MEALKTNDEFLTGVMVVELQEGRSTDQPVKVNCTPAESNAESP